MNLSFEQKSVFYDVYRIIMNIYKYRKSGKFSNICSELSRTFNFMFVLWAVVWPSGLFLPHIGNPLHTDQLMGNQYCYSNLDKLIVI